MGSVLRRFYQALDGPDAHRSLDMLAEDLRFSIVFSASAGHAHDFAGGRAEFDAYMAQRGTPAWKHHLLAESTQDGVELALGETRQDGTVVATFVAAIRLDASGRISRYIVGRSPAVAFDLD